MAGMAPLREQVTEAARLAKVRISSSSSLVKPSRAPWVRRLRRLSTAPKKVSPAPLVSATFVGTPGTTPVASPRR